MAVKKTASRRKGGVKKRFNTFISFADERSQKAALIQHADRTRSTFSAVARQMVSEFIEKHKLAVPSDDVAEEIIRQFSGNE